MRKVNLKEVKEEERKSPKGKYHKFVKDISIALGREPDSFDLSKRHPFDLAAVRIPKGKSYCPYHAHGAETELYVVISGRGNIRDKNGTTEVVAGDAFFFDDQFSDWGGGGGALHRAGQARVVEPDSVWALHRPGRGHLDVRRTPFAGVVAQRRMVQVRA